jgi:hypothetical protein
MPMTRSIRPLLFCACGAVFAAAAGPSGSTDQRLTLEGLGPIRIGMTPAQLQRAGVRYETPDDTFGGIGTCAQTAVIGRPGVALMFENGRVARIEIDRPGIRSLSGAQVGDTEAAVKRLYGKRLVVEGHKYDDAGHYLIVHAAAGASSMVFETDGRVVTQMRAGPAAGYVEGCA